MKKNFNVIQINGFKGILLLIGAAMCLAAGFIVFPGIVMKYSWNFIASYLSFVPAIGIIQGVLLWGIIVVSYFAFKKKGFFVEFKSADDLSREEMDAVMQRIRMERQSDIIARSILKAKELEEQARKEFEKENSEINTEINTEINQDKKSA